MKNKGVLLRFNQNLIEMGNCSNHRFGKLFYKAKDETMYSKKDVEDLLGISRRYQMDLREDNQVRISLYRWSAEKIYALSKLLQYDFEEMFYAEDLEKIKEDTRARIEEVRKERKLNG